MLAGHLFLLCTSPKGGFSRRQPLYPDHAKSELTDAARCCVLHVLQSQAGLSRHSLFVLRKLSTSNHCTVDYTYICSTNDDHHVVRVDLSVPTTVTDPQRPWSKSRTFAPILAWLIEPLPGTSQTGGALCPVCPVCCDAPGPDGCVCTPEGLAAPRAAAEPWAVDAWPELDGRSPQRPVCRRAMARAMCTPTAAGDPTTFGTLHSCFQRLPNSIEAIRDVPAPPTRHPGRLQLLDLPTEVLRKVVQHCDDVSALACTCRTLCSLTDEVSPGLLVRLHQHQAAALKRMLTQERRTGVVANAHLRHIRPQSPHHSGVVLELDCAAGDVRPAPFASSPVVPVLRGGFYCDEPGLGKTMTCLALVLRTAGVSPTPPPGRRVVDGEEEGDHGRVLSGKYYYSIEDKSVEPTSPEALSWRRSSTPSTRTMTTRSSLRGSASASPGTPQGPGFPGVDGAGRRRSCGSSPLQHAPPPQQFVPNTHTGARAATAAGHSARQPPETSAAPGAVTEDVLPSGGFMAAGADRSVVDAQNVHFFSGVLRDFVLLHGLGRSAMLACDAVIELMAQLLHHHQSRLQDAHAGRAALPPIAALREPWTLPMIRWLALDSSRFSSAPGAADVAGAPLERFTLELHRGRLESWGEEWAPHCLDAVAELSTLLKKMGLVPAPDPRQVPEECDQGAGHQSPLMFLAFEGRCLRTGMQFDVAALQTALLNLPETLEEVYLSPATLVIVPSTLVKHWQDQIFQFVRAGLLRATVLVGQAASKMTAAELAWDYDVVITTLQHLSVHGSSSRLRGPKRHVALRIHWLRVILDEGHMLGTTAVTNRLRITTLLRAERRWMMTGTPTPHPAVSQVGILQPLLAYLQLVPYGTDTVAWDNAVKAPFDGKQRIGYLRAMQILHSTVVRSSKEGVSSALIPSCQKEVVRLPFERDHQESYNSLIQAVLRNLLLADWFDENHIESVLNPKRSKYARELLDNVRLACCVAGQISIKASELDILETIQILARKHGHEVPLGGRLPDEFSLVPPYVDSAHPLCKIETALREGGNCNGCGAHARMVLVTPCAHVLCMDCVGRDSHRCAVCAENYEMQAVDDNARRRYNSRPRWPVPIDLIELQPAFTQSGARGASGGEWQPLWQVTNSSKCAYLTRRLKEVGALPTDEPPPAPPPLPAAPQPDPAPPQAPAGDGVPAESTDANGAAALSPPGAQLHALSTGGADMEAADVTAGAPDESNEGGDGRMGQSTSALLAVNGQSITDSGSQQGCSAQLDLSSPSGAVAHVCLQSGSVAGASDMDVDADDSRNRGRGENSQCEAPLTGTPHSRPPTAACQPPSDPPAANAGDCGYDPGEQELPGVALNAVGSDAGGSSPHTTPHGADVSDRAAGSTQESPGDLGAHSFGQGALARGSTAVRGTAAGVQLPGRLARPEINKGMTKTIVYSTFWTHSRLVEHHLRLAGAGFRVFKAAMSTKAKEEALTAFKCNPNVGTLLMDDTGAVGLDLSFVEYIFIMEPIADTALEKQIISRAHRLGAKATVHVEVLVMQGTLEDDLVRLTGAMDHVHLEHAEVPLVDAEEPSAAAHTQPGAGGSSRQHARSAVRLQCLQQYWQQMIASADAEKRSQRNMLLLNLRMVRSQAPASLVRT